jgi:hypothetical protein
VRPRALDYVEVSTLEVLDTVTLDGDELRFATGAAEDVFTGQRARFGWSAAQAFDHFTGWSNGYVALQPR